MTYKLPEGWREVRLGEVGHIVTGKTPSTKKKENFNGNIPFLTPSDDMENRYVSKTERTLSEIGLETVKNQLIPQNSICVSCIGSQLGKVTITTKDTVTNQQINSIVVNQNSNKMFVYYAMILLGHRLRYISKTSTAVPIVNKTNFSNEKIILPPLPEQKAIADTLSVLDDKIELNKRINANLEAQAQAIFKHWFIDFEFPDENGQPYKSSGGEMVESELGMIPKGWEVKSLDEVASFLNGVAIAKYRPKEMVDETLPAVKIRELRQGYTDSDSDRCLLDVDKKFHIDDYDMIFSWSGTLLIDIWVGGRAILNQHLFKVTSDKFRKWFYYYWTKFHLDRFISIARDRATTMGHIRRTNLSAAKVLVPTPIHYNNMELLAYILDEKAKLSKQNQTLSQLRDTLLPKLMNGEIRIPLD